MVAYGIGVLPLIKRIKAVYTDATQQWYDDDASGLGMFNNIGLYFHSLIIFVPGCLYYSKPSESVRVVHLDHISAGEDSGLRPRF